MDKKFGLMILTFICTIFFFLQPVSADYSIEWQKCLGGNENDYAYSIEQTADGGYIIAGSTESKHSEGSDVRGCHGDTDFWVVKIDPAGEVQWQRCLGGSREDIAYSITQTDEGGYIVAGYTKSEDGDVSGSYFKADYWIVKLDPSGEIQWQKCFGSSGDDVAKSIAQTADGGYIVVGYSDSNQGDISGNHGNYDYWIVKFDSEGEMQWQKCLGGTSKDFGESIAQTADGGYIVAGYSESSDGDVSKNERYYDYWVVKLDSEGEIQWDKSLGGTSKDYGKSIIQTTDGGYIVAGYTEFNAGEDSTSSYERYYYGVIKLDSKGNVEWNNPLIGNIYSISQTSDKGYILAGDFIKDYLVVKLDSKGEVQWQEYFGGNMDEVAYSITQTSDGGYVVAGYTKSNDEDVNGLHIGSAGSVLCSDVWIVKLNQIKNTGTTSQSTTSSNNGSNNSSDTLSLVIFVIIILIAIGGGYYFYTNKLSGKSASNKNRNVKTDQEDQTISEAEKLIATLKPRIDEWKKEGYVSGSLEHLDKNTPEEILEKIEEFEKGVDKLKKIKRNLDLTKKSYEEWLQSGELHQKLIQLENKLNDPTKAEKIETEYLELKKGIQKAIEDSFDKE